MKMKLCIIIGLLAICSGEKIVFADKGTETWHPNNNFFSSCPKEVQDKLNCYVTPFGVTPYKLSQEKRKKFGKVFSLWLTRLMNSDNIPSQDYIDTHIKLYPSKNNRLNEDLITLTYSKNNRQFYLIQTGGDYGELLVFFKEKTLDLQKQPPANLVKEIASSTVQSSFTNYTDKLTKEMRIIGSTNNKPVKFFINKNSVCCVFYKSATHPLMFSRVFNKDHWFALIDNEFREKVVKKPINTLSPRGIFPIQYMPDEAYREFEKSFRAVFDVQDALATVKLIRARSCVPEMVAKEMIPPFSSVEKYKMDAYEDYWFVFLDIYNKTTNLKAREILLAEWNKALEKEPKYFPAQIDALSIRWNKDMITDIFWVALKQSNSPEKDGIVEHIMASVGGTKEIGELTRTIISNKGKVTMEDIEIVETLFKKKYNPNL
jgi:hypothetical protein